MNIEQQEQNRTSTASTLGLESSSDLTTEINENSKHNLSDISSENIAFDSPISKELLGSVTIQKCPGVRTSARVIQKMKQDSVRCTSPPLHDRKDNKTEDKNLQKNTNQTKSASKNTWTNTEKNLFFDALNEYGKDFDAIHNFINSKIKKTSSNKSTKSKEQIRHSYYQTFHKLSKYIKFSDEIKKPAQELYALINYGEMRRKLAFVSEKNLMKIRELVYKGHVTVRSKGKSIRIKTPSCKALRKLNQLEDWLEDIKLPSKVEVCLRPATMEAWGRVQTIAQNPIVRTVLPLQKKLINLIKTFQYKWRSKETKMNETALKLFDNTSSSVTTTISATTSALAASTTITAAASATSTSTTMITTAAMTLNEISKCDKMNEGDQNLLQQQQQQQQQQLQQIYNLHQISVDEPLICLKPQKKSVIHRPLVSITQYLSSFNICLNSYEEKIGVKIRSETLWQQDNRSHSKRQRTDSGCEKKNSPDNKKCKTDMNNTNNDMSIIAAATSSSSIIDNDNQDSKDETEDDLYSGEELIDDKYEKLDLDSSIEINSNNFDDGIRITTTTCKYENSQNNSNSAKTTCSLSSPSTSTSTSTSLVVIDSDNKTKKSNRKKDKNLNKLQNNLKPFISDKILKKIRRGWTILNAADITVGDLYIVFGENTKLMFEYCWLNEKRPEFDITHISNIVPYNLTLIGQQQQHQYHQQQLQLQHQQQQSQQQQQQQVHLQQQKQQHKADKALIDKLKHESLSNKLKHLLLIANLSERIKRKQCTCGHICGSKLRLENESAAKSFVSNITYSGSHTDINVFRQPVLPLRRTLAVQSFKQIPNGHRIKQSKFLRTGKIGSRQIVVQRLLPVQPGINQSYDVLAPQLEIRTVQDDSTNISNATTATTTTAVANTTNQNTTSSNTTTAATVNSNVSTNNESNTISSTTVNELKEIELNNLMKNNTKTNDVNNVLDNNNYEMVMENNENNNFKEEIFSSPLSIINSSPSPSPSTSVTLTVSDCIEKSDENSLLNAINYNDNENCLNILKSNNSTTGNNNNNNNNNNYRHNNNSINNNQNTTTLEDSDLNPLLDLSIPSPLPITSLDDNTNDTITSIPPMSPMQLLRETNADSTKWLNDSIDFSLTSFLGHLEEINNRSDTMDNANISVISESSVDYVSKFAEIASMQNEERDL